MDEFSFIRECLAPLAGPEGLGLLDDAAVMSPREGYDLVLTKDTMVEGVHFPGGAYGADTAGKLLRVNLSDLAAKGATPRGYLLSLAWPSALAGQSFRLAARNFALGLKQVQEKFGFSLFGGDTVRKIGPMVISATFIGDVPSGKIVMRSGANPGDDVWVSGTIGDAYLGLQYLSASRVEIDSIPIEHRVLWDDAYWRPEPRLAITEILQSFATSSVDISDGLIADIGHIASASGIGITLNIQDVPISIGAKSWAANRHVRDGHIKLLTGGDDYEIAFTADPENRALITAQGLALGVPLTRIGTCSSGKGITSLDSDGQVVCIDRPGYVHF